VRPSSLAISPFTFSFVVHADQRDSPALVFFYCFCFFSAYDLDSDDLDDDVNLEHGIQRSDRHREQSMPLLVGLLDASAVRRSLDIPMGVDGVPACPDIDLDELAAKQGRGGGMLNSIANMANSILGAGAWLASLSTCTCCS